ncbi:hypothetical protein G7K_6626-t1 [Saitoella complicata NRRL Y-17804]|uniref:Uncharacterized protein n=2 Tax=Saitoella complicata (strain BCRC 22490 / CBS 7301 / JCM 7358 / NBRC 10748 / NRRL Y-17804) TaxID=698492 RepID=A0A0E9NRQ6_SAICN|nr:hypothetical protein G7K_6626-t1 [Saitoella complicata NRRL Y-17804]
MSLSYEDEEIEIDIEEDEDEDDDEDDDEDAWEEEDDEEGEEGDYEDDEDHEAEFTELEQNDLQRLMLQNNPHILAQIRNFLGGDRRIVFRSSNPHDLADDDDDDDDFSPTHRWQPKPHAEPVPAGTKLLNCGEFGPNRPPPPTRKRRLSTFSTVLDRTTLPSTSPSRKPFLRRFFTPNHNGRLITRQSSRAYSGQFSADGSIFYTCSQDFRVRLYDTRDTRATKWPLYKVIRSDTGRWTITDASLSQDNQFIAWSSITPIVYIAPLQGVDAVDEGDHTQTALDFSNTGEMHAGIWSLRFSPNNKELIAGASDSSLHVFDIEANRVVLSLPGHSDDVNAVSFADASSNILVSGSDDCLLKVWDRRSLGISGTKESGILLGHTEGVTFVEGRGDGRYVLSNSKDQTMKLWDLRRLTSVEKFDATAQVEYARHNGTHFDYRYMRYPGPRVERVEGDTSVVTYRGHSVLKTLIRCHFAPEGCGGKVISGSEDGKVHIYNLDGTVSQILDVTAGMRDAARLHFSSSFPPSDDPHDDSEIRRERAKRERLWMGFGRACVRDVSWHPDGDCIASTSWLGEGDAGGAVMVHEWREGGGNADGEEWEEVPELEGEEEEDSDESYVDE